MSFASRNPIKVISALFRDMQDKHDLYRVFSDCCEAMAISLANSVDRMQYDLREERYMQIVKGYGRNTVESWSKVLAELTLALESPSDVLGAVFHELELHNKHRGQFFTPYPLCALMASICLGAESDVRQRVEENGFITVMEPASGAGAMVIAAAEAIGKMGLNYQRHLHVTAIDIDPRAAHMSFIQLSLLHVPAVVVVGNSITGEERERWYTPAHILGGWSWKLLNRRGEAMSVPIATMPRVSTIAPVTEGAATSDSGLPRLQLALF